MAPTVGDDPISFAAWKAAQPLLKIEVALVWEKDARSSTCAGGGGGEREPPCRSSLGLAKNEGAAGEAGPQAY